MAVATKPPTSELGAQHQGGLGPTRGWASFIDEQEYVPQLMWPSSVTVYDGMRNDSQIDALHMGTTLPVREMRWSIDPNGSSRAIAEDLAADLGLPIRGKEDEHIPRQAARFNFDQFLSDAFLALVFGFMYFEIVGEDDGTRWRLRKLAPRHPRTIQEINVDRDGGLHSIRQNIPGMASTATALPPEIPVGRLLAFVWRQEAGSWIGRSMLRSLYREWLVKDRVIRVAAINVERGGGMPVIEGPQGASDAQLKQLAELARQFKVSEEGAGAIPFGSKLHLVGGSAPDAITLLKYCDEAMARVWALMILMLGQTETGSRALGGEFSAYAARAQRAIAKWVCKVMNMVLIERWVEWNLGDSAKYAPMLHFDQERPDSASTEELVAMVDARLITVDPELEAWLRNERGLPEKPENAPAPAPAPAPELPEATPTQQQQVAARRGRDVKAMLPARSLRRQPYEHETRAAVDFGQLEAIHETAVGRASALFIGQVIPAQISELAAQVTTTKRGTPRQRVTRAAMAALRASSMGKDALEALLLDAARAGAQEAVAEAGAQGASLAMPSDAVLQGAVADQADAVSSMAANGLSLAAQRKATSLVGSGRPANSIAEELTGHLSAMKHQWTQDELAGAVQMAANNGRFEVFAKAADAEFFVSALLDVNTCGPCIRDDGLTLSLEELRALMPSGGNRHCEGGPRCRCTGVMVLEPGVEVPGLSA